MASNPLKRRMIRWAAVCALIVMALLGGAAQPGGQGLPFAATPLDPTSKEGGEIPVGETLTYRIKWKPSVLLPALDLGTVAIRFAGGARFDGRELLRTEMTAKLASGVFGFSVDVDLESFFDPRTGCSVHTRNLMRENTEFRQQLIFYYPAARLLWLKAWATRPEGLPSPYAVRNELHRGTPGELLDPAALIYRLRTALPATGGPLREDAVYFARVRKVTLRPGEAEKMKTVLGEVRVVHYRLEDYIGEDGDRDWDVHIWATSDVLRVPVRVKAKVKIGSVEAELLRRETRGATILPTAPKWLKPPPEALPDVLPALASRPKPDGVDLGGMATIPGGTLSWGAGPGGPGGKRRPVVVSAFLIDRCEVTNAQYLEFVKATGRRTPDVMPYEFYRKTFKWSSDGYNEYLRLATPFRWKDGTYPPGQGDCPVVLVSWEDAVAYAHWAGKRLPTDAEWEWAARGGLPDADYPWGAEIDPDRAATSESEYPGLRPVGFFAAGKNAYGLCDMAGNAGEWIADWYTKNPISGSERNPRGPSDGKERVFRGGSWQHGLRDATVWYRGSCSPNVTYLTVGIRCAASLPADSLARETK